jgi:stringent starvation protein B
MSEHTAKPYLVRALYEWCTAHTYTPHLVVKVNSNTRVPMAYVREGQITLNVSDTAVHRLTMDNDWVLFNARFNGATQEVAVPMDAVIGIYARETGYGMGFAIPRDELSATASEASPSVEAVPATEAPSAAPEATTEPTDEPPKPSRSRAHLSVVK